MNYIVRYENFNESKGISDSCEKNLYKIWGSIKSDIIHHKSSSTKFDIDESDFKCKNIILNYKISIGEENLCNAQTTLNDSKIVDGYLSNINIDLDLIIEDLDDEFLYYIKSVLFHEFLHIFQHYNILSGKKFRPESFSIGSIIPQLRNIIKTEYGSYILDILYYSLSHELSAQIHQYYLYKINKKEYKRIYNIKNLLSTFKIIRPSREEEDDIRLIQKHIIGSITYFTSNTNYKKDINNSIWSESDTHKFLEKFKKLLEDKVKWIDKKINLVDKKIKENNIRYDENVTLPHNWEMYDVNERNCFIKENLNDSPIIDNI